MSLYENKNSIYYGSAVRKYNNYYTNTTRNDVIDNNEINRLREVRRNISKRNAVVRRRKIATLLIVTSLLVLNVCGLYIYSLRYNVYGSLADNIEKQHNILDASIQELSEAKKEYNKLTSVQSLEVTALEFGMRIPEKNDIIYVNDISVLTMEE